MGKPGVKIVCSSYLYNEVSVKPQKRMDGVRRASFCVLEMAQEPLTPLHTLAVLFHFAITDCGGLDWVFPGSCLLSKELKIRVHTDLQKYPDKYLEQSDNTY